MPVKLWTTGWYFGSYNCKYRSLFAKQDYSSLALQSSKFSKHKNQAGPAKIICLERVWQNWIESLSLRVSAPISFIMLTVQPYEPDKGILLDLVSALKSESEMNLKGRSAMKGEQIEMDNKIWSELPEELLLLVLSSLPTLTSRNLRVVCKRWQDFLSPSPMFRQKCHTHD
ncbi:hypothetical protein SUGI_1096940 [Cryptomeria japonica]|nr:hypothetical protein SUGI_1096940 [Cryptomeria japonica]